jgi:hypothetical protein
MRYAVTLAALLLAATACSDSDDPDTATDPGGKDTPSPTEIPNPVIVMDVRQPELCTGPVAESYPPQCGGPVISNWDWTDHKGEYDQVGQVRWGEFVVEGYYEGDEFVVTSAEPVKHSYS